ncbi:MAG: ATP-binding protein [Candidatus Nanoarchaeia archaeon]
MDITQLATQNPWWADKGAILNDVKIRDFMASPVQWRPRILKYIPLDKDVVYSVRGPRQVGKTTLVKIIIKDLLDQDTNPVDIFYYACDMIRTSDMLYDLLESYYNWNRTLSKGRMRIFFDEISAIPEWQKAIKHFIDKYGNKGITILLTSSHSLDIERSTERLPGRSGEKEGISTHKILLPMKFAEYVEIREPELYNKFKEQNLYKQETRSKEFLMLGKGEVPPSLRALLPLVPKLDKLLDEYLLTGGIMFAVASFVNTKNIPQTLYELYIRQLMGDISRVGRDERTAKQIIASIITRIGSRSTWHNIAKENGIPSTPTVQQYVHILQSMFILDTFYKANEKLQPLHASEKKLHLVNPFIFHALRAWSRNPAGDSFKASIEFLGSSEHKSKLIEGVVGDHLARASYNLKPSDLYDVSSHIFYWRTKKGHEIDFILKHESKGHAFDVAYQNTPSTKEHIAIKKFGAGCMISKNHFTTGPNIVTIPASLFLMYI